MSTTVLVPTQSRLRSAGDAILALAGIVFLLLTWPFTSLWKVAFKYEDLYAVRKIVVGLAITALILLTIGFYCWYTGQVWWHYVPPVAILYTVLSIWRAMVQLFFLDDEEGY